MIERVPERPEGWVIIDRRALDDARLSWAARGLLAYLLARPDDWRVSPEHLARQSGSLYQVRQLLQELHQAGYAELARRRRPDGTFGGSHWIIREGGFDVDRPASEENRDSGSPESGAHRVSEHRTLPNKEFQPNPETSATRRGGENRNPGSSADAMSAAADRRDGSVKALLFDRGIDPAVASDLMDEAAPEAIRRHVDRYDEARLDGRVHSVGWLVEAIRRSPAPSATAPPLLTPREAVSYVERRGFSLNAQRTLDHYFEHVATDDGVRLRPRSEVFDYVH
jgi:hypothetical protein